MKDSSVEQIKERLGVEEVISSYLKLERVGSNFKARCPFHNEKTPSFFVSPDRASYYCFGCGAKGDIFTFVEEFEGLDFKGALKILADRAGVVLRQFNKEEESEKERLYRAMEESVNFFRENLSKNSEVQEYLKSRGLTENSISDFRIGYAKDDWRELYFQLSKKGFTDIDIEKAGLAKKTDKVMSDGKQGFYDRFRGRIMFPISDSSGRVIAFSGRLFNDDGKSAKYLNSPETPIFSKSAVLYGLNRAKESIRKNNFSILVEGQFDLVLSHQAGYKNTIATSGTALSDSEVSKENVVSNLGLLRRLSPNIVLAFDGDMAGAKASERASKIALSLGMDVKAALLPGGVDPADLISKNGVDAWREVIRNSKHIIEFLLDKIINKSVKDERYTGREIKEKILPYVDAIDSAIEKAHFIKIISGKSNIGEDALKEDLKKVEQEQKIEKKEIENAKNIGSNMFRKDYIERRLLGMILWQNTLSEKVLDTEKIMNEISQILGKSTDSILEKTKDSGGDMIFEAEVFYNGNDHLKGEAEELLSNLREEFLKEELMKKMQELNVAERDKDKEKSNKINIEL